MNDLFNKETFCQGEDISSLLPLDHLTLFDDIDSTNTELLRRLSMSKGSLCGSDGKLTEEGLYFNKMTLASASQSRGKGRLGRIFFSPLSGLYFSYVYVPVDGIVDPSFYTIATSVAVCRAIDKLFSCKTDIKWVNDIYYKGKKICGILAEGFINPEINKLESLVVGIGINISFSNNIPIELRDKVGGIADLTGVKEVSRVELLKECLKNIMSILDNGENIINEYQSRSFLTGKSVNVSPVINEKAGDYKAIVLEIDENGHLIVQKEDGSVENLSFGEVSLHCN